MSEFEAQNEETICMVRNHRECYPEGERVILALEKNVKQILISCKNAKKEAQNANLRADAAEARVRTWHVIAAAAAAVAGWCGFLIGILI